METYLFIQNYTVIPQYAHTVQFIYEMPWQNKANNIKSLFNLFINTSKTVIQTQTSYVYSTIFIRHLLFS